MHGGYRAQTKEIKREPPDQVEEQSKDEEPSLSKNDSKNDDSQNDSKNHKQAACPVACILLVPTGATQLGVRASCILGYVLDVLADDVKLATLLMNDMCDVTEQLVQFTNALLDVADLCFPFDDKTFLEIHLMLVCQARLLLQLLLLKLEFAGFGTRLALSDGSTSSDCRCALLLQRAALNSLEFVKARLKFG